MTPRAKRLLQSIAIGLGLALTTWTTATALTSAGEGSLSTLKISGTIVPLLPPPATPDLVDSMRSRLVAVAMKYASMTYVPYVYGGANIADRETCDACQECVRRLRVSPESKQRLRRCPSCQVCGVDCSHFVHMIYTESGLDFPYANTAALKRIARHKAIPAGFHLVDLGSSIDVARPGDLLLYPNHIVMLVARGKAARGDIIHATRLEDDNAIGGIMLQTDRNLLNLRGPLIKILRHRALLTDPLPLVALAPGTPLS